MKHLNTATGIGALMLVGLSAGAVGEQTSDMTRHHAPAVTAAADTDDRAGGDADNTKRNKVDRNDQTVTPMDQSNNDADLAVTKKIREALTADDTLSLDGKNIKVVTAGGKVTLRGPVASREEHDTILRHAKALSAPNQLHDELEVKASK